MTNALTWRRPMTAQRAQLAIWFALFSLTACGELPTSEVDEVSLAASSSARAATSSNSLTSTAVSNGQIDLSWNDEATSETGWQVHRSTSGPAGAFTLLTTTSANVTGYSDTGLTPLTQYCYRVRSFRTTGKKTSYSAFSNVACATTQAPPLPAAPSGVNATPFGTMVRVVWTDNSTIESGFRVERAPSGTGPWTFIGTTGVNVTVLDDPQAVIEQQTCYRVIAFNAFGNSGPSAADCTTPPAAPTNLAAVPAGSVVDLVWTDNSSAEDGFAIERSADGVAFLGVATVAGNTTSHRDGLPAIGTYWYRVRATKDGGGSDYSSSVRVVDASAPPSPPASLHARPSGSAIEVVWDPGPVVNEDGYRIELSPDGLANWVTLGFVNANESTFAEYSPAEQLACARVIAFNPAGDSPPSAVDCTVVPRGPTDINAVVVDSVTVDLTWSDNSAAEDGYEVFGEECGWWECWPVLFGELPPNATTFRLQGWSPWVLYDYQPYHVVARRDGGYSVPSDSWWLGSPPAGSGSAGLRASSGMPTSPRAGVRPRRVEEIRVQNPDRYTLEGLFFNRPITTVTLSSPPRSSANRIRR